MFLETYAEQNGYCLMDFTQRSSEGPGYSRPNHPTDDFHMDPGGGFGEHTAAILRDSYLAVQYNQRGVRYSAMPPYLREQAGASLISIIPVIQEDVFDRFTGSSRHGMLTYSVYDSRPLEDMMSSEMETTSALRSARDIAADTNAGVITVSLSYGSGKRGGRLANIGHYVADLMRTESS